MKLEGIHHITAITGDAPQNVRFYVGLLGLRLVKKSVNQDDPTVYHLFYADEFGSPGSDLTFFEYPGVAKGHAGAGMIHRIIWRVPSEDSLNFWTERLESRGVTTRLEDRSLRFVDPEGLELEMRVDESKEPALLAKHPEIPIEHALMGFNGVRAYSSAPEASESLLSDLLEFAKYSENTWQAKGNVRSSLYSYDEAPSGRGISGAGTVHHVAWASPMDEHEAWHHRLEAADAAVTPIIDRYYFRSIYFREPSGVLFEIATIGPGFTTDEPADRLGERLSLPPQFEPLRARLENVLTPLPDVRAELAER